MWQLGEFYTNTRKSRRSLPRWIPRRSEHMWTRSPQLMCRPWHKNLASSALSIRRRMKIETSFSLWIAFLDLWRKQLTTCSIFRIRSQSSSTMTYTHALRAQTSRWWGMSRWPRLHKAAVVSDKLESAASSPSTTRKSSFRWRHTMGTFLSLVAF